MKGFDRIEPRMIRKFGLFVIFEIQYEERVGSHQYNVLNFSDLLLMFNKTLMSRCNSDFEVQNLVAHHCAHREHR